MISQERIEFAFKILEKLESNTKGFSIEDAKRRLRILEVLSK